MSDNLFDALQRHLADCKPHHLPWPIEKRRYSHCDQCQQLYLYDDLMAYGRATKPAPVILCYDCLPDWALAQRQAHDGLQELYMRLACEPDRKRTILSYLTGRRP